LKLSIPYITAWFKERIISLSRRYETGIWSAEDIEQEVTIRLSRHDFPNRPTWSKYHQKQCRTHPAFVIRQAWRECQKIRRHETRRLTSGRPSELIKDARASDPATKAAVLAAIDGLTDRQRIVLELKATLTDPTMTNISRACGLSRATVCRTLTEVQTLLETAVH
jgi:DNA-directed RNA polymerase specialized sigma24 family protein